MTQVIWFEDQVPLLGQIGALRHNLIEDYVEGFDSFDQALEVWSRPVMDTILEVNQRASADMFNPGFELWRSTMVKWYNVRGQGLESRLATAKQLVSDYDEVMLQCEYLVMKPGTYLDWHQDLENKDRCCIRLHIPLIVPQGDIGLELRGVESLEHWDRPFAFDNQCWHRAWNRTAQPRLILSVSVLRSYIGIEPYLDAVNSPE